MKLEKTAQVSVAILRRSIILLCLSELMIKLKTSKHISRYTVAENMTIFEEFKSFHKDKILYILAAGICVLHEYCYLTAL